MQNVQLAKQRVLIAWLVVYLFIIMQINVCLLVHKIIQVYYKMDRIIAYSVLVLAIIA